jgi:hypothetical protein
LNDAVVEVIGALGVLYWDGPVLREGTAEGEEVGDFDDDETEHAIAYYEFDKEVV